MPKAAKIAIGVVCAAGIVFCAGSYALDRYLLGQTYARYVPSEPALTLVDSDIADDYPYDDVSFQLDGQTLRGHVYGAGNDERGLVIFRHGIFSHHQDYLALICALVDEGWKVFAYDAIGCGESDGDTVIGFAQSALDVHAAVQFARQSGMDAGLPVVLFGHSWGGYGVAGALDFDDGVAACVTMSGFDAPNDIILESARSQMGPIAATQAPFIELIGGLDFGEGACRRASRAIDASGIPVLVIHGTEDAVVSFDGTSIISKRAQIANPLVTYIEKADAGRNGHNTYFYSRESQAYLAECARALGDLQEQYAGEVPDDVLAAFMQTVDKRRANTADPELIGQIDSFLAEAIGESGAQRGDGA